MEEFNSGGYRYYGSSGYYGASNIYVFRSSNRFSNQYGAYTFNKQATPPPAPAPVRSNPWYDCRQLKSRKRIAKYKLHAVEGKVKRSLKKSFRWIKRTCRKIVRGF